VLQYRVPPNAVPRGARCIVFQFFYGPYIFAKLRWKKFLKTKNSGEIDNRLAPVLGLIWAGRCSGAGPISLLVVGPARILFGPRIPWFFCHPQGLSPPSGSGAAAPAAVAAWLRPSAITAAQPDAPGKTRKRSNRFGWISLVFSCEAVGFESYSETVVQFVQTCSRGRTKTPHSIGICSVNLSPSFG
jgi:hypothetical protein